MRAAKGNYAQAAEVLGCSDQYVRKFVSEDPSLKAIYHKNPGESTAVGYAEREARTEADPEIFQGQITKFTESGGDQQMFRKAIEKLLEDDPETLKRLDVFKGLDKNVGMMMAMSVQTFQGCNIDLMLKMVAQQEELQRNAKSAFNAEERQGYYRLANQSVETYLKLYKAQQDGMAITHKMLIDAEKLKQGKGKGKGKPGFQPMTAKDKDKDAAA